jgi:hypothetical protein
MFLDSPSLTPIAKLIQFIEVLENVIKAGT